MKRLDAQRGFSLLEILAALAIGVLMMTSLTAMVDVSLQDTKSQQVARYQEQFTAAASRYINDNAATLYASAGTTTGKVTLATLQLQNYLPNSFAPTNAYQQTPCVLVRQHTGSPNAIDALVVTEGLNPIPPKDLAYVAANAGSGGGVIDFGIPAGPSLIAHGTGWQLDTAPLMNFIGTSCSTTPATNGSLASALFYGGPSGINRDVLYRSFTGDATLNTMTTPLGMSGGASNQVMGTGCGTNAAIALDANRNILTCDPSGKWSVGSSWKEPVADFGALSTLTLLPQNGDVRMTLNTGRAFMYNSTSSSWKALALDENGTLNVPTGGNINVAGGNVNVTGNVTASGTLAANNINATLDVIAGQDVRAARDAIVQRDVTSQRNVRAAKALVGDSMSTGVKVAGDVCNYPGPDGNGGFITYLTFGTIVRDVNGLIMECQNSGAIPGQGQFIYVDGTSTTPPP